MRTRNLLATIWGFALLMGVAFAAVAEPDFITTKQLREVQAGRFVTIESRDLHDVIYAEADSSGTGFWTIAYGPPIPFSGGSGTTIRQFHGYPLFSPVQNTRFAFGPGGVLLATGISGGTFSGTGTPNAVATINFTTGTANVLLTTGTNVPGLGTVTGIQEPIGGPNNAIFVQTQASRAVVGTCPTGICPVLLPGQAVNLGPGTTAAIGEISRVSAPSGDRFGVTGILSTNFGPATFAGMYQPTTNTLNVIAQSSLLSPVQTFYEQLASTDASIYLSSAQFGPGGSNVRVRKFELDIGGGIVDDFTVLTLSSGQSLPNFAVGGNLIAAQISDDFNFSQRLEVFDASDGSSQVICRTGEICGNGTDPLIDINLDPGAFNADGTVLVFTGETNPWGVYVATAVPEPAGWVLILVGIGVVLLRAHRPAGRQRTPCRDCPPETACLLRPR